MEVEEGGLREGRRPELEEQAQPLSHGQLLPPAQLLNPPMLLFLRMGTGRFSCACLVAWALWALRLVPKASSAPMGRKRTWRQLSTLVWPALWA